MDELEPEPRQLRSISTAEKLPHYVPVRVKLDNVRTSNNKGLLAQADITLQEIGQGTGRANHTLPNTQIPLDYNAFLNYVTHKTQVGAGELDTFLKPAYEQLRKQVKKAKPKLHTRAYQALSKVFSIHRNHE